MPQYVGIVFGIALTTGDQRQSNPQATVIKRGIIGGWGSGHTSFYSSEEALLRSLIQGASNPQKLDWITGLLSDFWYSGRSRFAGVIEQMTKSQLPSGQGNPLITPLIIEGTTPGTPPNPVITPDFMEGILGGWSSGHTSFYNSEKALLKSLISGIANPQELDWARGTTPGLPAYPLINNTATAGLLSGFWYSGQSRFTGVIEQMAKGQAPFVQGNPLITPLIIGGITPGIQPNPMITPGFMEGILGGWSSGHTNFCSSEEALSKSLIPWTANPQIMTALTIIKAYVGGIPAPRTKVYIYYGNPAAQTVSDWSSIYPDPNAFKGAVGGLEIQHLTTGKISVEHPAIKRIEFYDNNGSLVWLIANLSDISAGRIIKSVRQDLNMRAAIAQIRVITASGKTATFYI